MIFRKLEGEELIHARNLWDNERMPELIKAKAPWLIPHWRQHADAHTRGCPNHCPECKKRLQRMFVPGWKRGKVKPLIRVHAAQIFHCKQCDLFWATSLLKIEVCGYRCRYDGKVEVQHAG